MSIGYHWVLIAAGVISLLVVLEDYTGYLINQFEYPYSWYTVPAKALVNYGGWALLAPIIDIQAQRLIRLRTENRWQSLLLAVLVAVVVALIHRGLAIRLFDYVYFLKSDFLPGLLSEKNQTLLMTGWITSIIQYTIILLIFLAVVYYKGYLQKQKELNEAQLRALKMQLHPHFLFNTLHSIAALIDIEPKAAQKMVSQLGGLMRNTLDQDDKSSASLHEEISYIKNYLDIEHVRFQDRLEITYDIEEAVSNATLPYLILQPLIENAIKHGMQDVQEAGTIKISAIMKTANRVVVTVEDNGLGLAKARHGKGLGLENVLNRLSTFYSEDFRFDFGKKEPHGFAVSMEFPYQEFKKV
ncbi:MAG: histidine kinase [Roseivirga sp.]|nr:histidine kinase [Roseivirga sp.]